MAADRHLEFSKFGILVMCPVLERDSALSYKISRLSDNHSLSYSQKTIFKMADGRHIENCLLAISQRMIIRLTRNFVG